MGLGARAAALVLGVVLPIGAQGPKHSITIADLAKLVRVGAPVLSPDGLEIAYTVSRVDVDADKNVSELWMVGWDGKNDVQLTYGPESAGSPQWSPDGRYLAFTSSRPGKAKGEQVWLLDRRGGEARQVTDVKQDLDDYRWSPDSQTLLLTLKEKEEPEPEKEGKPTPPKPVVMERFHFKEDVEGYLTAKKDHLYLFDLATKKLERLTKTSDEFQEGAAEWSPDGKSIAFVSNQSTPDPDRTINSDVFVVAAKAGSVARKLTAFAGEDEGPLAWSPDSRSIAYRQGMAEHYSIYDMPRLAVVDVTSAKAGVVAESLDNWAGEPVWDASGRSLLTTVGEDRVEYVAEVSLGGALSSGGDVKRLTAAQGVASGLSQKTGHLALLWSTDATAPEIYALEGGALRKLTAHNDALLAQLTLAQTEDLSATTKDGNEVHGMLTMPASYIAGTKAPMLLFIHGGPTAQDTHDFDVTRQMFAAHGYAVLQVNYRGSTGRGHAYSATINADWGNKEVIDLLAMVDAAVATDKVDPDKLAVGGWSYGGILTDYLIASTTRFKAASSGAGMGNLLGLYGVDEYIQQYQNEIGPPWKNVDAYVKLSYPFFHADRIRTPTMFLGGDSDFNVPVEGGEQMYQALKSVGTPAEMIVYPGQFHGFTRPSFIKDRYERWFAWYDKYLGMTPAPKPAATPASAVAAQ
jgi:dipeptidyl aminopeptidase/acylaminoacyl peptidase